MFKVTFNNADCHNFTCENLKQAEQVAKCELLDVANATTLAYIRDEAGGLVEVINCVQGTRNLSKDLERINTRLKSSCYNIFVRGTAW